MFFRIFFLVLLCEYTPLRRVDKSFFYSPLSNSIWSCLSMYSSIVFLYNIICLSTPPYPFPFPFPNLSPFPSFSLPPLPFSLPFPIPLSLFLPPFSPFPFYPPPSYLPFLSLSPSSPFLIPFSHLSPSARPHGLPPFRYTSPSPISPKNKNNKKEKIFILERYFLYF